MERVILHCDMNNYFATVEEKYDPALRTVPFAVCGDPEMRHSIVMAKNALAKQAGVITGLSFYQARELCPDLCFVRADYSKYLKETGQARRIYRKYTDAVVPYGLDEAWIDLTETGVTMDEGREIADLIRLEIRYSQGLSASVGVSDNRIFSKLGSDYRKPDATTVITRANYRELVWPLPAADLLFVGEKRAALLAGIGVHTIGELATSDPRRLTRLLGKAGDDLWRFANGDDRGFHPEQDTIGSIGNTITPPEDLHTDEDVSALLYLLVNAVGTRLHRHGLQARCLAVIMKDSRFNTITRQCTLAVPTDHVNRLFSRALALFRQHFPWTNPLRSLGVRVDHLIEQEGEQLSLFSEDETDEAIDAVIDERVRRLTARLGELHVETSATNAASREW